MSERPPTDRLQPLERGGNQLKVGDLIRDRYRLERLIASGSMGHVLEATDTELGRRVAIKVARKMQDLTGELERRLLLEARAAAKLRGRHVAHIFEIGRVSSGLPFVVMEFLIGENLEQVLERRKRVEVGEAINWALQAALALAEAHAMGIVHRDIKPENLFLAEAPDGEVVLKVLDFGASAFVAKRWQVDAADEMLVGTPLYMSPERIQDPSSSDPRSDIWALGAVIYELLVGVAPFDREGANVKEIIKRTLSIEPESLHALHPGVAPALSKTVIRCLQKDPASRFPDIGALAQALARSGRPGSHGVAQRVVRILERAPKSASQQPIAENPVPTPRAPMPTVPLLLKTGSPAPRAPMASEPLLLITRVDDDDSAGA